MKFSKIFSVWLLSFLSIFSQQAVTEVSINNPAIDSLEKEQSILKIELMKDPVFYKCRNVFFDSDLQAQLNFVEQLESYKDTSFILNFVKGLLKLKNLELEELKIIFNNMEMSNEKGMVRLHIRAKQDQIRKVEEKLYSLIPDENDIEHNGKIGELSID